MSYYGSCRRLSVFRCLLQGPLEESLPCVVRAPPRLSLPSSTLRRSDAPTGRGRTRPHSLVPFLKGARTGLTFLATSPVYSGES